MRSDGDIITREPLNAETPPSALGEPLTPLGAFFTRNNFPVPRIAPAEWRLQVGGLVDRPRAFSFDDLRRLPAREMDVVLECAGNGRTLMTPLPEGTGWREGAVGCARFRGASFADVAQACGIRPGAVELVFRGADAGKAAGREMSFERSLPVAKALHPETLLCYEMNGEPLRPEHGAPVRLLVPGWYGVASVKWLVEARAVDRPFEGHFQRERYVYEQRKGEPGAAPVREMRVKSLFASPLPGAAVRAGATVPVAGWAWSGAAPVARVDVSDDGGRSWHAARLGPSRGPYAWRGWTYDWTPTGAGEAVLLCRATDEAGRAQPDRPEWNVHGYGYNAPQRRVVRVQA